MFERKHGDGRDDSIGDGKSIRERLESLPDPRGDSDYGFARGRFGSLLQQSRKRETA